MVDVSSQNNSVSINVSSGGNSANIKATPDMAQYYSEKSREWAISTRIVDNTDYSSKYYAEKSATSESNAKLYAEEAKESYNGVVAEAENTISQIAAVGTQAVEEINSVSNNTKQEVTQLGENLKEEIVQKEQETIADISQEAQKQLQNVQSTGFYMRDGKLYFINSKGEEEEFKSGGSGFSLGDIIITDHILEGEEAIGKALQGTYVYKNGGTDRIGYPDFYNKCLEEKNNATVNEATLGESTLTMYVNDNGHQFYNIADKTIVDAFYETFGIADFYGIDEENERIFLPRDKYFAVTGGVMGNGMTLGLTTGSDTGGLTALTASGSLKGSSAPYGQPVGTTTVSGQDINTNKSYGITTDPEKSGIVLQPNENRYLYYCVGNTQVTSAVTNVTEITTSENDTIPMYTGQYFDFNPNHPSWLKAGEQQNRAGIYTSCYDGLVEAVNGTNPKNLKVINEPDMVADVDYDEYWILDQDNMTFRTPLTIATKSLSGGVAGNEMSLGLMGSDGVTALGYKGGLADIKINSSVVLTTNNNGYGALAGAPSSGTTPYAPTYLGVTSDPTKSGIIAEQSTAKLYFKVANAVQNLELLNVGEVMEGLADKIGRQECKAYITETYQNGTSWYRIYSDGWCEQGGYVGTSDDLFESRTVTLLKEFLNDEYAVVVGTVAGYDCKPAKKTATTITFSRTGTNDTAGMWVAYGYIA